MKENFKIDFAGIGAPKCATTWLYQCLKEHPQLYLLPKDNKKAAYFAKSNQTEEFQNYYNFFLKGKKEGQLAGEFSTRYIFEKEAAERMKSHNPEMKIIVSLRNPSERAFSAYIHHFSLSKKEKEWLPFKEALKKAPKAILEEGFYAKHLKNYFNVFGEENILVLIVGDIKENSKKELKKLYSFLEVDNSFVPQALKRIVSSGVFKTTKLGQFFHKKVSPSFKKSKIGWKLNQSSFLENIFYKFAGIYAKLKTQSAPSLTGEERNCLLDIYKEDIEKLEKLIKRDLSFWK